MKETLKTPTIEKRIIGEQDKLISKFDVKEANELWVQAVKDNELKKASDLLRMEIKRLKDELKKIKIIRL